MQHYCYLLSRLYVMNMVFFQMFLKRWVGGNLKVGKKAARITRLVIVCAQHLGRHRLSKTPTARHTAETTLCKKRTVDYRDKPRLVNIFTVPYPLESSIADIEVCSHDSFDFAAKVTIIYNIKALKLINPYNHCHYRLHI